MKKNPNRLPKRRSLPLCVSVPLWFTLLTDYAQPADEDQVWSIWKANARVQR
jgi:hypothetical protein